MQFWWLIIIIVVCIAAYYPISYALKIYPILSEANKVVPYLPLIISVVSALVKWFTQSSLSIKGAVRKPPLFRQNTSEDRQGYFLNVNRLRGKERPKECQGRLQISEAIDGYPIWRTTRKRFSDIGTDDDLLLFEILNTDSEKEIVFHLDSDTPTKKPYTQFEHKDAIVSVDAINSKACKPYKKKISDVVKEANRNSKISAWFNVFY
jgi:hypothetical protein